MEITKQGIHSPFVSTEDPHFIILKQMMQASMTMNHIDELLVWLTYTLVEHLDIQVMQIWAKQTSSTGQASLSLRTTACQDRLLPEHVVSNKQIAEMVGRLLRERRSAVLQPVDDSLSSYQAKLLTRYGLNYWSGHFLDGGDLYLQTNEAFSGRKAVTQFDMMALLFLRRTPSRSLLTTTSRILEQVIPTMQRRQLLLPPIADINSSPMTSNNIQQRPPLLSLAEIIPHRVPCAEAMHSRSPFTRTPVISDKLASRLYLAVDDRKSLVELLSVTQMGMKEMETALRILLMQKLIQLFDLAGQPIDRSLFINYSISAFLCREL